MPDTLTLPAALVLAALAGAQEPAAYLRAVEKCDAEYVKKTTACRRAVGNYRCLQLTLDRLSACRQQASRLLPATTPGVTPQPAPAPAPAAQAQPKADPPA